MNYTYAYVFAQIPLGIIWAIIYYSRKDLRNQILFVSFLGLPLGFIEAILVPNYWNPPSLFNLIDRYGFGIESFIFAFFISGIATAIYEFIEQKKRNQDKAKK
ncbi:MAG: hypothetical protein COU81_03930 [Candidatus Portnoybacteria bacterium CG10_big_fil_rev_8_21_14_0_10_36_7]|uniref:Lycopene cyclase domain-containing protein n=1 Tax=Candidatus Portnoybacteria bacterium CG10_big_fil_rev_8_21_14_0_10_36_7 TaxID=1974812 RepID=A0A2M8KD39_9BACT|nr:MAG: hypothetical protein COU81_03930 [Candidatus Portnoybacteria bacterium CG10_big_fil_rev_8_21_14_0_10_36_7]